MENKVKNIRVSLENMDFNLFFSSRGVAFAPIEEGYRMNIQEAHHLSYVLTEYMSEHLRHKGDLENMNIDAALNKAFIRYKSFNESIKK